MVAAPNCRLSHTYRAFCRRLAARLKEGVSFAGETRDTADMGMMSTFLGEKMVPSKRRARLFRTWGAGIGMLPVGGQAIWGNQTWAPDDTDEMRAKNLTFG